jgi:hypothetical protein
MDCFTAGSIDAAVARLIFATGDDSIDAPQEEE